MAKEKTINGGGASTQSNSIGSKTSVLSGYSLSTSAQTIVGAINEILPKATGVGKVDTGSDGTGEIFNSYEGEFANVASESYAHAEGLHTIASRSGSHAEGIDTTASGQASHAEGSNTTASGSGAHAEGKYTQTFETAEHAEGSYNKSYDSEEVSIRVIHSVGIGSQENDRKNAHEIKFNGDHYIYGVGGFDGTNSADAQTLQEVINSKQATITAGTGLEFEGNTLNVTLDTTVFKVVSALPDSPAQGDENKIHLVPAESTGANNAYTEYVWVNSAWEILGEYTSEVDLTPYLKTADAANTYLSKTDAASTYLSKTDASSTYLNKTNAVGKIDSTSDGTGEIFNSYTGSAANVASGACSHAEGKSTNASGNNSHAEGYNTIASGVHSHAEGLWTEASGGCSHAEGRYTLTSNVAEHAEGQWNLSSIGDDSSAKTIHSVGIGSSDSNRKNAHEIKFNGDHYVFNLGGFDGTNSDTAQSLQEVINSKQDATDSNLDTTDKTIVGAINEILSKATGVGKVDPNSDGTGEIFNCYESDNDNFIDANQATGRFAHAEGRDTVASGDRSHAEGRGAKATGLTSHAEGDGTRALGDTSHAEGFSTTASGDFSHAEGYMSEASGDYSHAEGMQNHASGRWSHAEGWHTAPSGNYSHAEGDYTSASGEASHAEGLDTQTFGHAEHAEGAYNKSYDSEDGSIRVIHSVGIGALEDRKNAHEIKFNGDHYVLGVGGFDGTNSTADTTQTLQEVIQSLLGITIDMNQTTTGYTNGDQYYNIYDLSSLNYVPGCAIIFQSENSRNNSIRLKFIYAYDESGLAETIQFTESDSMTYDSFTLLSPLITNMGVDQLTVFHGKINSENEFKYYLVIQTTVGSKPTNS